MNLSDTHIHLPDNLEPSGFLAFYERAASAGVPRWLVCSSDMENTRKSAEFAARFDSVYFAAGVYPHLAEEERNPPDAFRVFADQPRFAAIGEIGLDFYYEGASKEKQESIFAAFLRLARELHVPAIVHCRDKEDDGPAYDIALKLLAEHARDGGTFVMHAFAGTPKRAADFAELGAFFGVGGMMTFKHADNIRTMLKTIPRNTILLETDTPYLAPVPFRGNENHPEYIPCIARALAALLGLSFDTLQTLAESNPDRFLHGDRP